jgi:CHAT domain-containing protein
VYRELEELLLELERPDEAFHVTERARARALLAHLGERQWRASGSVPPELEREKRMADAEYDRAYGELGASEDDETRGELQRRLDAARRRQDDLRGRIRAAAPRLAPFQDPVPDDLAAVRRGLDPGTLLLSYRIGPEASRVYAVGPGEQEFAVFELHAGEAAVRGEVRAFRQSLDARRGPWLQAGLFEQSRRLGKLLLAPVADRVARAERLLILPDGVLYLLPFAALADPASGAARRFLVESKPLHVASSATLYEQLARGSRRLPSGPLEVVGFGDPAYATGGVPRPALRPAVRDGLHLAPLPFSRRELSALRELSPGGATLWLGPEATETRAKAVGENARIVHFACHGFVDERFPLESGLALSTPGDSKAGDNGLLQAWEVFEGVHIDADLVTLSACRTGLGEELAGEGLLGLAWAFEYAGARSVLASLWEVDDSSTAVLMRSFYRALRAGAPKAEALRRAQLELLRRSPTAAPYFWAAFQLIGDGH